MAQGKPIVWILGGCLGAVVLMVASCAGLLYFGYQTAADVASPRIDSLFASLQGGTFADTYETLTAPELRDITSKEDYVAMGEYLRERVGGLRSKTLTNFNVQQNNAESLIDVTYNAQFEKGPGTITAQLKKIDGEWKFTQFNVKSPLLVGNDEDAETSPEAAPIDEQSDDESP